MSTGNLKINSNMGGDKSTVFSKGGRGGRGVSNYHDRIVVGLKIADQEDGCSWCISL